MSSIHQNIEAVILAGGKASRMNHIDKGLIKVNGEKIIERLIEELKSVARSINIISNNDQYDYLGMPVYSDIYKNKGPIGGIHAALSLSEASKIIVVGCDMPFLSAKLFEYLIENSDTSLANVVVHGDHLEPLCSIYDQGCLEILEDRILTDQFKMMEALEAMNYNKVNIDQTLPFYHEKLFVNINAPEDLENLRNEN